MKSSIPRALFVSGATVGALLIGAGAASAHVVVSAPDAAQGGYSVLTFRVPTESDTASTNSVKVTLPGLNSARTQPIPGWTSTVEKDSADLAVSVTWTANPGAEVGPGQFQQFLLSAGPLPEQETVSFPATQTYTDGEVVEWNEPMTEDERLIVELLREAHRRSDALEVSFRHSSFWGVDVATQAELA